MALTYVKSQDVYYCLSTDISNNKLTGASQIGSKVFTTDTELWYIILSDLTLSTYEEPVSLNGSITIGTVVGQGISGTPAGGLLSVQGTSTMTPIIIKHAATSVSPAGQASTASYVLVAGSILDTLNNQFVGFTIQNTGANTLTFEVQGGNASNLSDGVVVNTPTDVTASGFGSYSGNAIFRYYGVFEIDKVGGSHGQAVVLGVTKG
jgi:hypothetical protein